MLHRIGKGPKSAGPRGVVARLSECHERIRRHVAIAIRLAEDSAAPGEQVTAAAEQCIGYFHRSLPHHSADEDDTIAPRLPVELAPTLRLIAEQHVAIHALLDLLVPLWQEVADRPDRREARRTQLAALATELETQFAEHLAIEESAVFDAIQRLPASVQDVIIKEMIGRRTFPHP